MARLAKLVQCRSRSIRPSRSWEQSMQPQRWTSRSSMASSWRFVAGRSWDNMEEDGLQSKSEQTSDWEAIWWQVAIRQCHRMSPEFHQLREQRHQQPQQRELRQLQWQRKARGLRHQQWKQKPRRIDSSSPHWRKTRWFWWARATRKRRRRMPQRHQANECIVEHFGKPACENGRPEWVLSRLSSSNTAGGCTGWSIPTTTSVPFHRQLSPRCPFEVSFNHVHYEGERWGWSWWLLDWLRGWRRQQPFRQCFSSRSRNFSQYWEVRLTSWKLRALQCRNWRMPLKSLDFLDIGSTTRLAMTLIQEKALHFWPRPLRGNVQSWSGFLCHVRGSVLFRTWHREHQSSGIVSWRREAKIWEGAKRLWIPLILFLPMTVILLGSGQQQQLLDGDRRPSRS